MTLDEMSTVRYDVITYSQMFLFKVDNNVLLE